jgi:hypothetical protein
MNKIKTTLLLLLVFIATTVLVFYFENRYRALVRYFFTLFQGNKIQFVSKNFHLFASPYLLVSFGLFCVLLSLFLYRSTKMGRLFHLGLSLSLFFITTMATTFLDSTSKIIGCTACQDGIKRLHYNAINYDFHFITSLSVALLPLFGSYLKKQISKKRHSEPAYNSGIVNSKA